MSNVQNVICVAFNSSPLKPQGIVLVPDGSGKEFISHLLAGKYQVLEFSELALSTIVAIMTEEYATAVKLKFAQYTYGKADYEAAIKFLADEVQKASNLTQVD